MRIAIVGFPLSGKTTLYSALTGLPRSHFRIGEENLAAVKIHEPRLDWLAEQYQPKKRTEATMDFVDLPTAADEEERAGLEKHLPSLRQADGLLAIVRQFKSDAVPPHHGKIDPQRDLRLLRDEMLLADLTICSSRIEKLEAALKRPAKDHDATKRELALLLRCRDALESEQPLSGVIQAGEEEKMVRSFGFLTQKPVVLVINVGEAELNQPPAFTDPHAFATFAIGASVEADLIQVEPADRALFMADYGVTELAGTKIIRACFESLGMIHFLTAGPEEVRSWPIPRGYTAVEAAGRIHTDLARGFIKAETVSYEDLRTAGGMREAKASNKVRQEPKTYVIHDGDVVLFKHSG